MCSIAIFRDIYIYMYILGECRTLWGEREQAKHCCIELWHNCYVPKALPVKYMKPQHTGYAWHIPKTKFVTINSIVMLGEKSLSWSSTTHWSHFSTTTQLLWLLDTQAIKVN